MGCHASGNRKRRRASTAPTVTGGTSTRRPRSAGHVLSVIECDVEAFIELRRETLQRRVATVDVYMADDAHGDSRSYKLSGVATYAGFVSRENRRCRVIFAFVTRSAGE